MGRWKSFEEDLKMDDKEQIKEVYRTYWRYMIEKKLR